MQALYRFFLPSPLPRTPKAEVVRETLAKALEVLHEHNIVFGDLRPLNILHSRDDDRVFLVDFDWAGKDEEARYSPCLNEGLPGLAPGVGMWAVMKKSHDNKSLEWVINWLSGEAAIKHPEVK